VTVLERRVKIGHTAITWPRTEIETAFSVNINDPGERETALNNVRLWAGLLRKHKVNIAVLGGDGVDRRAFNFSESKKYMVDIVNEIGKYLFDMGIYCCFHPHTDTPVETKDEIYSFMDAVDPEYVFFAPDVGQIQKGGADPVPIINTYLSKIKHVHLKDYKGGEVQYDENGKEIDSTGFASYTPLGQGVVELEKILGILENSKFDGYVMVELDARKVVPIPREEALLISKNYLINLGYTFVER